MSAKSLRQEFVPTLRLALPLAFAELGWMSMGIVDTIMVGRLPNSAIAIGATGLGELSTTCWPFSPLACY